MVSQPCWRCFARLNLRPASFPVPQLSTPIHARLLSTTSTAQAQDNSPRRGQRTLKIKTKKRVKTHKIPAVGERKAIRQRVVLSNTNALEVQGMQDWQAAKCADESLLGSVVGLPAEVVDGLRAIGSFKPSQGWGLFRRPASLIRQETLDIARTMEEAHSQRVRRLVSGAKGSGKSVWLLQAQAVAFMKGWVVIHIPEAKDMTNATTAYAPIPKTSPQQYSQPDYTAALLARIARANESILSKLTVSLPHDALSVPIRQGSTLLRLAETGAQDPAVAWPVFNALWAELTTPNNSSQKSQARPQIMLSLDGVAHISRQSAYLRPDMHHVHAYDLALVSHFMAYLSGERSLPNGGAVIAADSLSNRPLTSTLDLAIRQSEERTSILAAYPEQAPTEQPLYDPAAPYTRVDERVLKALRTVHIVKLAGFSREETRAALEYYARSGMLRARVTEGLVGERWAISGGGLVGELEKASVGAGVL